VCRFKNTRSSQGIGISIEHEVSVSKRNSYASEYGKWHSNSNFITCEEFKTKAVRYGLMYKAYALHSSDRKLLKITKSEITIQFI
jgi:hypothetical protein